MSVKNLSTKQKDLLLLMSRKDISKQSLRQTARDLDCHPQTVKYHKDKLEKMGYIDGDQVLVHLSETIRLTVRFRYYATTLGNILDFICIDPLVRNVYEEQEITIETLEVTDKEYIQKVLDYIKKCIIRKYGAGDILDYNIDRIVAD